MRIERGFTLVELVITIAIMAIALLFVVQGIKRGAEQGNSALWQVKAVQLAVALLDQQSSKRYDEASELDQPCRDSSVTAPSLAVCSALLGPEEASRDLYDDVDDLHGFNSRDGGDNLNDLLGGDLEAQRQYAGYAVSVAVSYVGSDFGRASQDLKRVTLYIFPPGQDLSVAFSSYRGNY